MLCWWCNLFGMRYNVNIYIYIYFYLLVALDEIQYQKKTLRHQYQQRPCICVYTTFDTCLGGLKNSGFQRTRQRSWPFYAGKVPKLDALEVVFDFIDLTARSHYKDAHGTWAKPTRAQLEAALDTLLAPV